MSRYLRLAKPSTFLCLLFALCQSSFAQKNTPSGLLGDCKLFEDLSSDDSTRVNDLLRQIDSMPSTTGMIAAHIELMKAAGGSINYCEIERRLRELNAKTYLLALPYQMITGPTREYSLIYPQPLFPTWSRIPKFAIWYERKGRSAAIQRLKEAGINEDSNLANLNTAGILVPAQDNHKHYIIVSAPDQSGLNKTYEGLYAVLEEYRSSGYLSNDYNPMLMYALDAYADKGDGIRYTINDKISSHLLQFYVIEQDPRRIMSGFPCNCAYIPRSDLIICDKKLLSALASWVQYGKGEKGLPSAVSLMNDGIADLLLHWLVLHEVGHYVMKHEYDAYFVGILAAKQQAKEDAVRPDKKIELAADEFALRYMPEHVKVWAHMATNFIIQQLVGIAKSQASGGGGSSNMIKVREPINGHPNFLSRVYSLKDAAGAVDFLLEEYQSKTVVDPVAGAQLPSVCSLSDR